MHKEANPDPTARYTLVDRNEEFSKLPIEYVNKNIEIWAGICSDGFITQSSYLLVLEGSCTVDGIQLDEGDAVEIYEPATVFGIDRPHLLLFELK